MSKKIVVSGGASGIGAAVVQLLLKRNCEVWNLDVVSSEAKGIQNIYCDLSQPAVIDAALQALAHDITGCVDGVINVAGVAPDKQAAERVMAINFLGMRHLLEGIVDQVADDGSMVIVASSAGRDWRENATRVNSMLDTSSYDAGLSWLKNQSPDWQEQAYQFSKQCAAAFTYRAAGLARDRRVRVNCINPGIVDTGLTPAFRELLGEERFDTIVRQSGRAGTPQDIAELAEFLLLGPCQWLNGVEMTVDGGYYAGLVGGWIPAAD